LSSDEVVPGILTLRTWSTQVWTRPGKPGHSVVPLGATAPRAVVLVIATISSEIGDEALVLAPDGLLGWVGTMGCVPCI